MHRAERRVAGLARRHDHPERHDVRELLERHVAPLHLLPDREGRLLPARQLDRRRRRPRCRRAAVPARTSSITSAPWPRRIVQPRLDGVEGFRLQLREGERLQLGLASRPCRCARPAARRSPSSRARCACAARRRHEMQRAHVVQAVGELHQQDADVAADRQHELAEILRLLGAVRLQLEPGQLGDAIDQPGDLRPEPLLDLGRADRGVLDHVVQQRR